MKFWIKNFFFVVFVAGCLQVTGFAFSQHEPAKRWVKTQLQKIGIVARIPRDAPEGLNIGTGKNRRYLETLRSQYPLEKIPVPKMLSIRSGTVYMGCLGGNEYCKKQAVVNEKVTQIAVSAFQIAETETTVEQWDACVAHGGCKHMPDNYGWGRGDLPVVNVSWLDVQEYIAWLNSVTQGNYRLPSNAEWEYAAKAGTTTRFPWGNELPDCDKVRHGSPPWMPKAQHRCQIKSTWSVKSKQANPWGLYHVIGNAAEWVAECGLREVGCKEHINRGGNWVTDPETSVLHTRNYTTDHRYNRVGLRLAR